MTIRAEIGVSENKARQAVTTASVARAIHVAETLKIMK